ASLKDLAGGVAAVGGLVLKARSRGRAIGRIRRWPIASVGRRIAIGLRRRGVGFAIGGARRPIGLVVGRWRWARVGPPSVVARSLRVTRTRRRAIGIIARNWAVSVVCSWRPVGIIDRCSGAAHLRRISIIGGWGRGAGTRGIGIRGPVARIRSAAIGLAARG